MNERDTPGKMTAERQGLANSSTHADNGIHRRPNRDVRRIRPIKAPRNGPIEVVIGIRENFRENAYVWQETRAASERALI